MERTALLSQAVAGVVMTNVEALETTLKALNIGDEVSALVALARDLAAAVDRDTDNASLVREYRSVVLALMAKANAADEEDDDTAGFWVSIRTPSGRAVSREES